MKQPDDTKTGDMFSKKIEKIRKEQKAKEVRKGTKKKKSKVKTVAKVIQLPIWPDDHRAMPNEICRSALFSVRRGKRESYMEHKLYVVGNDEINYTGHELRASDDELVWQQMLHYARFLGLPEDDGGWVDFTAYQACKDIGWPTNGAHYKKLRMCLTRLSATSLQISRKGAGGKACGLLDEFEWQDDKNKALKKYRVKINGKIILWFGQRKYTQLEWNGYRDLSPIARRLYDYCSSHKKPHPIKLETAQEMCGSTYGQLRGLRRKIKEALAEIVTAKLVQMAWVGEDDLIHFER